jgi:cystathionine beta-lyase/cystathionine gamma-synthase
LLNTFRKFCWAFFGISVGRFSAFPLGGISVEQRKVTGLSINTIRLSIGLEDPQDLIDDLDQAFVKAFE